MADQQELIPHLFRTEYSKIVAVLCKRFGFEQIEIAEDIASDTFLTASENWSLKGLPANPTAWLYHVAKNKARNYLNRDAVYKGGIIYDLKKRPSEFTEIEIDLSARNIRDSQLQMMFAVCHPSISVEAQIALSLRYLCGFGIEEIADAFLSNKETINKRLFRAKEKLRAQNAKLEVPGEKEINDRIDAVLTTLYLLFSEGYYSISERSNLPKDFCLMAMRLCYLLVENDITNRPNSNALLSLMCFHASRFEARSNKNGELILYEDQDVNLWDQELIQKGEYYLNCAASGNKLSKYHLEAGIAYWHTIQSDTTDKWKNILELYNELLHIEHSPIAQLNRIYALSKIKGRDAAISEAEKLNLTSNHFYFTLLGELYNETDIRTAKAHLETALKMVKTRQDRQIILSKLNQL